MGFLQDSKLSHGIPTGLQVVPWDSCRTPSCPMGFLWDFHEAHNFLWDSHGIVPQDSYGISMGHIIDA